MLDFNGNKFKGCGVYTVPQTGGLWTIVEKVSQMGPALLAYHLSPNHAMAGVLVEIYVFFKLTAKKTRPSATGVELGFRLKKFCTAAHANIYPLFKMIPVLTCKRGFSAFLLSNIKL